MTELTYSIETWPLAQAFNISRGAKTEAVVVVATLTDGVHTGRGECVPYARYGETVENVTELLGSLVEDVRNGLTRADLQILVPPGAARNALDCAFWDLEAKRAGRPVWQLAGCPVPLSITTAFSLSLDTPDAMGRAAASAADRPLLKIKLGGDGDRERLAAIRTNAPDARIIVDANEGWTPQTLEAQISAMADHGVSLIEQPLPANEDECLRGLQSPVPLCADESCHGLASLGGLVGLYDAVNIKLDKTGGLTEALATTRAARDVGFDIMIGCMVGTSLGMAPAMLLAEPGDIVDLDGPLWLAEDRPHALEFTGSIMAPATPDLWG